MTSPTDPSNDLYQLPNLEQLADLLVKTWDGRAVERAKHLVDYGRRHTGRAYRAAVQLTVLTQERVLDADCKILS